MRTTSPNIPVQNVATYHQLAIKTGATQLTAIFVIWIFNPLYRIGWRCQWKHFSYHWPFVKGNHRSLVDCLYKWPVVQCGVFMFPFSLALTSCWPNNRVTSGLINLNAPVMSLLCESSIHCSEALTQPTSPWWMQMSWHQICTRASATTMPTGLTLVLCKWYYIRKSKLKTLYQIWKYFNTWLNKKLHENVADNKTSLKAMFMGPTWGPPGAEGTQMGPMLAPWTLLSGLSSCIAINIFNKYFYSIQYSTQLQPS